MKSWFVWRVITALLSLICSSLPAAADQFEERLPTCLACHGEGGQSQTPEVPSLGAQPIMYTLIELYMFREKLRIAPPMNDMAEGLSDAELQKFAETMNKLPPPQPALGNDPVTVDRARALIAQHRCGFCHANDLSGTDNVPRLAGQREDYLLKSLREYKAGQRTEYQPVMAEVVAPMKDVDFVDLAHYLARFGSR